MSGTQARTLETGLSWDSRIAGIPPQSLPLFMTPPHLDPSTRVSRLLTRQLITHDSHKCKRGSPGVLLKLRPALTQHHAGHGLLVKVSYSPRPNSVRAEVLQGNKYQEAWFTSTTFAD